ncbi:MAG TPA: glycosyltransferase [Puia sp.]|nr:glycosyltransferase [Puia sp.]
MAERNLLFFIFRLHGGGAERVVSNLSMDFASEYNIKIAVFDRIEKVYPYKGELIRIHLPFSDTTASNNFLKRGVRLWDLVRELRRIKKQYAIDTTISFGEPANIINAMTNRTGKTVLSVRTLLSKEMDTSAKVGTLRSFIRLYYGRADQVIVPSKVAGQDLVQNFGLPPDRVKVIYNYLDKSKVDRAGAEEIDDPFLRRLFEQPVLLNVGRITPAKGQWLLLELLPKIREQYPDWKLVIIGEAEKEEDLKERLVARARQLFLQVYDSTVDEPPAELDHQVYLLGYQANPYRFMRRSRILLFPSVFEGFPNTMLEAMQNGLPVIAADCQSGPREIMAPDSDLAGTTRVKELTPYGILCPPLPSGDIETPIAPEIIAEWTSALLWLLKDRALRESIIEKGLARVNDFNRGHILQQWRESMG